MGIYIFLLVLLFFACRFLKPTEATVLMILLLLFVISAGRGEGVGIDTANYFKNGFSSNYAGENHKFEVVFIALCDMITALELNPRCCIYMLSATTFIFLFLAAKRFKVNALYVLFYFLLFNYFTHSLNVARQMAACSILLYAYSYLLADNNKHSKLYNVALFIIFTFVAASFHVGAILGIIGLVVLMFNSKSKGIHPIIICSVFIILFALVQLSKSFLLSQSIGLLSTVAIYDLMGAKTTETSLTGAGFIYRSFAYIFYGTALFFIKSDTNSKLYYFYGGSILLRIFLSAFYGDIYRLGFYFSIIDIIVFSYCSSQRKRTAFFLFTLLYFGIDYYLILLGNTYETVPYVFNMIEL